MTPLLVFWTVLRASALSTGGLGNVPALHADWVRAGLVDERAFAAAIAVGQLSPGPNGLWVVVLGYDLAGLPGATLALLGAALPPLLVLATSRLYHRARHVPAVEGAVWGLGLTVAGVSAAVLLELWRGAGPDPITAGIGLAALGLGLHGRAPVILVLLAGAVAGIAFS